MGISESIPLADTWGMHGDVGAGWMVGMMVVMVIFWGGIVLGVLWLIRAAVEGRPGARRETALELLERRFADGAVSVQDYGARRELLAGGKAKRDEPTPAPRDSTGREEER